MATPDYSKFECQGLGTSQTIVLKQKANLTKQKPMQINVRKEENKDQHKQTKT